MLISECFCTQVPLAASQRVSPTEVTADNQYDSLAGVVTPLWQVPYQEQLEIKQKWSRSILWNFIKKLCDHTKGKRVKKISYRLHQVKPSVSGLYRFLYSEFNRKGITKSIVQGFPLAVDIHLLKKFSHILEPEVSSQCSHEHISSV
jgi:hypothetical protein